MQISVNLVEQIISDVLSGSEALYGFCGWLTTRDEQTRMSSIDDCGAIADLIDKFVKTNNLEQPKDGWENNLIHPQIESIISEALAAVHDECESFHEVEEGDRVLFRYQGELEEAEVTEIVFSDGLGDYFSFKVQSDTQEGMVDMEDLLSVYRNGTWKKLI